MFFTGIILLFICMIIYVPFAIAGFASSKVVYKKTYEQALLDYDFKPDYVCSFYNCMSMDTAKRRILLIDWKTATLLESDQIKRWKKTYRKNDGYKIEFETSNFDNPIVSAQFGNNEAERDMFYARTTQLING